jgi:hypothetical protein
MEAVREALLPARMIEARKTDFGWKGSHRTNGDRQRATPRPAFHRGLYRRLRARNRRLGARGLCGIDQTIECRCPGHKLPRRGATRLQDGRSGRSSSKSGFFPVNSILPPIVAFPQPLRRANCATVSPETFPPMTWPRSCGALFAFHGSYRSASRQLPDVTVGSACGLSRWCRARCGGCIPGLATMSPCLAGTAANGVGTAGRKASNEIDRLGRQDAAAPDRACGAPDRSQSLQPVRYFAVRNHVDV